MTTEPMPGLVPAPANLPAHAYLIPRAERLNGDPARGWYFAVLVRATVLRHQMLGN